MSDDTIPAIPPTNMPQPGGSVRGADSHRIAAWLARAGVASRRGAEALITAKRVKLNNQLVTHPATFVGPGDLVSVDGALIAQPDSTRVWRYHKPAGLVTTHSDPEGRRTVFSALPAKMPRVVSIGRLDLNSEGLLLLTNDGAVARRLELPQTAWLRRYRVRVHGAVDESALARLAQGITVEGVRYGAIEAGLDSRQGANAWLTMALREGRNREIRRVLAALELQVTRLIRTGYGPFQLGSLARGAVEEVPTRVLRGLLPPPVPAGQERAHPDATDPPEPT